MEPINLYSTGTRQKNQHKKNGDNKTIEKIYLLFWGTFPTCVANGNQQQQQQQQQKKEEKKGMHMQKVWDWAVLSFVVYEYMKWPEISRLFLVFCCTWFCFLLYLVHRIDQPG